MKPPPSHRLSDVLNESLQIPETQSPDAATPRAKEPDLDELRSALQELNSLIGLAPVKGQIKKLVSLLEIRREREAQGLRTSASSLHMVFVGPPGTGKTTVARLMGKIFKALAILDHGEVREVARADLVAEFLGATAKKTNDVVEEAVGGILFIDEAYSLIRDNLPSDYGVEAVDTLLKRMEDERDRLVVIVAGYDRPMTRFLDANPGLRSRFTKRIAFPDYSPDELMAIIEHLAQTADYAIAPDATESVRIIVEKAWRARDESFGNARFARNFFEAAVEAQAERLAGSDLREAPLRDLSAEDVRNAVISE